MSYKSTPSSQNSSSPTPTNIINQIPIAFSLNNVYVYPIIVSITSILYNSARNNFFTFYLLLAPDVQEENLKKYQD